MTTAELTKPKGFQKGHPRFSGPMSETARKKMSAERKGSGNPMWQGGKKSTSICLECKKNIVDYKPRNYCSKLCAFRSPLRKELHKAKIRGHKNNWKGDRVGYHGLHYWKKKISGNPLSCENCKIDGYYIEYSRKNGQVIKRWSIEWANKSREYKRDLDDWLGLCHPCHSKYDQTGRKLYI